MRLHWCHSLSAADFPRPAYEALRSRLEQATPYNHLGWLDGAERALQAGQQLHVLLGWEGEQLVLCLPLILCRERRAGMPLKVLRHLGYPLADRIGLMLDPGQLGQFGEVLEKIRRDLPHALLQLSELPAGSVQGAQYAAWQSHSWYAEQRTSCQAPVHRISEADRAEPSGDIRYKLRKARKNCQERDIQLRRVRPDADSAVALFEALRDVERASWKGTEGVGIFSGEARQRWMFEALQALAAADLVRVVLLEHQGRCISYRLGLLERGRLYDYNVAFRPEYANLNGGRLLLDEWIRWGLDDGWQWVDASRVRLSGSGHQLHERQDGQVEHQRWSFYSRRPSGLALGLAYGAWRQLKPHLQRWRERAAGPANAEPSP